jgi:hypothetical protein
MIPTDALAGSKYCIFYPGAGSTGTLRSRLSREGVGQARGREPYRTAKRGIARRRGKW